jgi:ABC-type nickel/cobalt efflux system permease component RcnA
MTAYRTRGNKLSTWNCRYYPAICLELLSITTNILAMIFHILTENWNRSLLVRTQGVRNGQSFKWQCFVQAYLFFAPALAYLRTPRFDKAPSAVLDCGRHKHTHAHTHTHTHAHTRTHTCKHTCTHTHTHAQTHAHTQTHIYFPTEHINNLIDALDVLQ